VVGVSDGGVRLLTEMDPVELSPGQEASPVTDELAERAPDGEPAPDRDFQAAFERASADVATAVPAAVIDEPTARPPVADAQGALTGSLLSASTWRLAWDTATGRAHHSRPGDAA
jgi:hypothetical protein